MQLSVSSRLLDSHRSCFSGRAPQAVPVARGPFLCTRSRSRLQCTAQGTPVPKNSILVVGGTGTLGRQVVRKALDEGYEVRCTVKPRLSPADFLRDWGATTVQADLTDPTSLPATLVGISAIIDCATARPEESTQKVDWEGKVALIQCAQAMGIKRYLFMSIFNCEKHPEVPLMNIKAATEEFLATSSLEYTILRLCGFHQVCRMLAMQQQQQQASSACGSTLLSAFVRGDCSIIKLPLLYSGPTYQLVRLCNIGGELAYCATWQQMCAGASSCRSVSLGAYWCTSP
eukprot:GHRR01021936.1.p1 GENE.GHRR01021936.1~~GHRR01021936.1.p1  ORF type:complete len:287 (+),score=60.39 GHRR01021936.1:103-963(+)